MSGSGASDDEMLIIPWQARPLFRAEDTLLSGQCAPEQAPPGLRPVAEALTALRAPAGPAELAGWPQALAGYRDLAWNPAMAWRPEMALPGRPPGRASLLRVRTLAAAGATAAALLGGGVAAAYTGSLPPALQTLAHDAIAAPDAHGTHRPTAGPSGTGRGAGPVVTGSPAHGLCTAYLHAQKDGNASQRAVAFRNLARVAGGAGKVAAYCAGVPSPGAISPPGDRRTSPPGQTRQPSEHGSGNSGNGNSSGGNSGNGNSSGGNSGNGNSGGGNGRKS
jgi:uncharacterized membrane protein YgcG